MSLIRTNLFLAVYITLSFDFSRSHYLYPLSLFASYCFRITFFSTALLQRDHFIFDYFIHLFLQFFFRFV